MIRQYIFFCTLFLLFGHYLAAQQPHKATLVEINGEQMLIGKVTFSDILHNFPEWKSEYDTAAVDINFVQKLNQYPDSLHILLFLGTWCPDSRHGVPPFMKSWEKVQNPRLSLQIVAVDREKTDPDDLAQTWHIERVPTFVVLKGKKEIGRLVEIPVVTFTQDLLHMLEQQAPTPTGGK